jgi:hypothetical protein
VLGVNTLLPAAQVGGETVFGKVRGGFCHWEKRWSPQRHRESREEESRKR